MSETTSGAATPNPEPTATAPTPPAPAVDYGAMIAALRSELEAVKSGVGEVAALKDNFAALAKQFSDMPQAVQMTEAEYDALKLTFRKLGIES
jgi:hypothetical protein